MSLKVKLTSLITTFILLCSLLTVGVFAVKNTTFNVGGDIVFNVQGIEADIELTANGLQNAVLADNAVAGTDVMNKIEIRNNTSADSIASQFAKWSNLDMTFADGATTATIEFKITNMASEEDNYIDITALADATTKNNAKIKVENNAGGVTALLQQGDKATFTITFSVIDDGYSASLNGFSVNFDMQKKVLADFPKVESIEDKEDLLDQYEFSEYSTSAPYTVAIAAKGASSMNYTTTLSGDIVVPDYVNKDGIVYAVTKLSTGAFGYGPPGMVFDCTSLTLPKTLTTFGDYCFYTTKPLSIEIPYGVTSIGDYAFYDCYSLTSITIPDTVTSIGYNAFYSCKSLSSITIPEGVISIGKDAFGNCSSLKSIVVESGNSIYDSRNSCNAIVETATNSLIKGCEKTVIPDTVTNIGYGAFRGCTGLTNIVIPDSVTSIGISAFNECDSLTSITIPKGVTSIGDHAFFGCDSLTSITIPDSVTSIGDSAFWRCSSLTDVYYRGTQEQWNALLANVGEGNEELTGATIHYEHTGE